MPEFALFYGPIWHGSGISNPAMDRRTDLHPAIPAMS